MGMEEIKKFALNKNFDGTKKGKITKEDAFEEYENFLLNKIKIQRKLKIVLDTGNGSASRIAKKIFEKTGCEVIAINDFPDGNFPSHTPDVREKDLQQLKEKVLEVNADFGVGFDCDADRAAFIDEKGNYLGSGNTTICLFSEHYLKNNKNAKIVFDVTCSSAVEEFIKSKQGVPVLNRVGHAFIVNRMIKEKAIFGGEYSNHLYFSEIYGFDDAIFAGLKMAEILSKETKKLSELTEQIPKYYSTEVTEFPCSDEKKFEVIEKIKNRLNAGNYNIIDLDGVKVITENGSLLIRASNTAPAIKINSESKNKEEMNNLFELGKRIVAEEIR
jgi:phosphomannomutase